MELNHFTQTLGKTAHAVPFCPQWYASLYQRSTNCIVISKTDQFATR